MHNAHIHRLLSIQCCSKATVGANTEGSQKCAAEVDCPTPAGVMTAIKLALCLSWVKQLCTAFSCNVPKHIPNLGTCQKFLASDIYKVQHDGFCGVSGLPGFRCTHSIPCLLLHTSGRPGLRHAFSREHLLLQPRILAYCCCCRYQDYQASDIPTVEHEGVNE